MNLTYLTTQELAEKIKYNARTIRTRLKDSVLFEGRHYIRPFGGRKTLYIWEHVDEVMEAGTYFYMGEGEMEESEIIELLKRDFPDHPVALHFMFDDT